MASTSVSLQTELNSILSFFKQVSKGPTGQVCPVGLPFDERGSSKGPDDLHALMERLRQDMEIPTQPNFRSGTGTTSGTSGFSSGSGSRPGTSAAPSTSSGRQFATVNPGMSWRSGITSAKPYTGNQTQSRQQQPQPYTGTSGTSVTSGSGTGGGGKYVSKFVNTGSLDNKILKSVIGNKLNCFTSVTYNDTRDFIYQILDSGETEFIKDFIEKVFAKATLEDLYCALFAKLIAEIAHRYPVMYEEMERYHTEFIKIFDDAGDGDVLKRQYRMGYGQFLSELASLNTLDKKQLIEMVKIVSDKIWELTTMEGKSKVVEEFADCLVRLSASLKERSPLFFTSVKGELVGILNERVSALIARKAGDRPSLSSKARFALMDLKDLL